MKPKPTHGGARKGSGRPASGRKAYTVRLKPAAMRVLLARAKSKGLTLSEYLEGEAGEGEDEATAPCPGAPGACRMAGASPRDRGHLPTGGALGRAAQDFRAVRGALEVERHAALVWHLPLGAGEVRFAGGP